MDVRGFSRAMQSMDKASKHNNMTDPVSLTDLPPNILDSLIPGYSLISRYMLAVFGIDISLFVSLAVISLAVTKGGQYLYSILTRTFRYLFVSSVYIDEHDDLFDMLMDWLAATQTSTSRRSVRAKTQTGNKSENTIDNTAAEESLSADGLFDYTKWSARTPPRYEPYYGRHILWYHGRPLLFHRSQRSQQGGQQMRVQFGSSATDDDLIQLDCIGRSVEPLRDLLREVKIWSLARQRHTTTIRHPLQKERARWGGMWSKTHARPSRPMHTVILDAEQKDMIINDMNEYLHPSSPRWYANRGIPYRRGYLFHGAPGTGKTSLSFALAGIFGLEIYCISLQEPTLTEGDLMQLFNALPRRCVVLLEDVDAAGLIRDGKSDPEEGEDASARLKRRRGEKEKSGEEGKKQDGGVTAAAAKTEKKTEDEYTLRDLARELKSISAPSREDRGGKGDRGGPPNRAPGTGISLSGLLNAIDGVASHEGRVLIMTTNHPEKLDSALVRPGRVDRRVEFRLAMHEQIRELFVRMYDVSDEAEMPVSNKSMNGTAHISAAAANGHVKQNGHVVVDEKKKRKKDVATPSGSIDMETLAEEFASKIPEDTFTPAEIQNHLMRYKKEPWTAVEKVEEWMEETKKMKENDRSKEEEEDDEHETKEGEEEVVEDEKGSRRGRGGRGRGHR